ncbi:hypothetical protein [Streptomyces sp. NPDC017941]|uniref:hypothetical protein n=1 Tax=Streptomyces sp. NPDC017941 TaxID=3365018 RepID=UPI0037B8847D
MKFVGFYRDMKPDGPEIYGEETPSINPGGAPEYSFQEVSRYLHSGHPVLDVMESTTDIIGQAFQVPGGSSVLTDGSFSWRADLASYVEHYAIALPPDFLDFMRGNNFEVPHVPRDRLLEISVAVSSALGFRTDAGAAPGAAHG